MVVTRIDPIMRVSDVASSVSFYRDQLGFQVHELGPDEAQPLFARLGRDGAFIMIVSGDRERKPALSGLFLEVDDLAAMYVELLSRGVEPDPVHPTRHGTAEIDVYDPEGHIITFGQPLAAAGVSVPKIFDVIERGDVDALQQALEADASIANTTGYFWWWGGSHWTALEVAAAHGQLEAARLLLDHGADLNGGDTTRPMDWTPLQLASFSFPEVAKLLLERGAEVDVFSVAGVGDAAALAEGLSVEPDLVRALGPDGATALHFAAAGGHVECVRLLLKLGADPQARDGDRGETPAEWGKSHADVLDALSQIPKQPFTEPSLDELESPPTPSSSNEILT